MLLLWLMAACGDAPSAHDAGTYPTCTSVFYADSDGDGHGDVGSTTTACTAPSGFTSTHDDCDDSNAAVHPGADELCNALDDDCDGMVDLGAIDETVWFVDADGDGFGGSGTTTRCSPPPGFAAVSNDCDDGDAEVHPAAAEVCDDVDDDCDGLIDDLDPDVSGSALWYVDGDNDGYGDAATSVVACGQPEGAVADDTDCDDAAAVAHPGADEICDGLDDDCDGLVDDDDASVSGRVAFYEDADGDGLGNGGATVTACFAPSGYVSAPDDCDDTDATVGAPQLWYWDQDEDEYGTFALLRCDPPGPPSAWSFTGGDCRGRITAIHPGAAETCNGDDDDCDGLVDGDDPLVVAPTWYADHDGDGFGDPTDTATVCGAPPGYIATKGDCDDSNAEVKPSAVEWCDGIDNDCTGTADDGLAYIDWYADHDGDGYGIEDDVESDCAQPSGYAAVAGDCNDSIATVSPSGDDLCGDGVDGDCDGALDNCVLGVSDADVLVEGGVANGASGSVIAFADLDGDGMADLVDGAPGGHGAVLVSFGPLDGTVVAGDLSIGDSTNVLGWSAAVGDADDDGADDVLAGACTDANAAYLFLGPVTADRDIADADAALDDDGTGALLGYDVAMTVDVDGDLGTDLLVGAPYVNSGGTWQGDVYVLSGAASGNVAVPSAAVYDFEGEDPYEVLGVDVGGLGDVDGDGIGDLLMSSFVRTYVVLGGTTPGAYVASAVAVATLSPARKGVWVEYGGAEHQVPVDYDNDGTTDVLFGDQRTSSAGLTGAVYAFHGPLSGALGPADAAITWRGGDVGFWIATGDCNDDKAVDLVLGGWDDDRKPVHFLSFGPASGTVDIATAVSLTADAGDEAFGGGVAFVPDWTGDGVPEVAVGHTGVTTAAGGAGAGAVYVYDSQRFY